MNPIREMILMDIGNNAYTEIAEHNDLICFVVSGECFNDEEINRIADFAELIVIVDKEWLFSKMLIEGIANPRAYLKEEYTSDDSYEWYMDAVRERKVVMVSFN